MKDSEREAGEGVYSHHSLVADWVLKKEGKEGELLEVKGASATLGERELDEKGRREGLTLDQRLGKSKSQRTQTGTETWKEQKKGQVSSVGSCFASSPARTRETQSGVGGKEMSFQELLGLTTDKNQSLEYIQSVEYKERIA